MIGAAPTPETVTAKQQQ